MSARPLHHSEGETIMRPMLLSLLGGGLLLAGSLVMPDTAEARPRGYYRGYRAPAVRYYAPRYAYPRYYAPRYYYYGGPGYYGGRYYGGGHYDRGYAPGVYFGGRQGGVYFRF
jgi:hypothetical protein